MNLFSDKVTRRSRLSIESQNLLINAYVKRVPARRVANAYELNRHTISLFYRKIRRRLIDRLLFETTCFIKKSHQIKKSDVELLLGEFDNKFSIIPAKGAYGTFFKYHLVPMNHHLLKAEKKEIRIEITQRDKDTHLKLDEIELSTGPLSAEQFSESNVAYFTERFYSRISIYRGVSSMQFISLIAENLLFESLMDPRDITHCITQLMQEQNEHNVTSNYNSRDW